MTLPEKVRAEIERRKDEPCLAEILDRGPDVFADEQDDFPECEGCLIDAAADLLQALRVLVSQTDTEDHLGPMIAPSERAVLDARAAIAKAEGRP